MSRAKDKPLWCHNRSLNGNLNIYQDSIQEDDGRKNPQFVFYVLPSMP